MALLCGSYSGDSFHLCGACSSRCTQRRERKGRFCVLPGFEEYFALIFHVNTLYTNEHMESYVVCVRDFLV